MHPFTAIILIVCLVDCFAYIAKLPLSLSSRLTKFCLLMNVEESLLALTRRELQAVAKLYGIQANLKSSEIILEFQVIEQIARVENI